MSLFSYVSIIYVEIQLHHSNTFRCFGVETGQAGCAIADVVTNNVRQSECIQYLIQALLLFMYFKIFSQVSDAIDGQK